MKIEEFKDRVVGSLNELIDIYYGEETFVDKIVNSTLKVMLQANKDKMDEIICMCSNKGEIDAETIVRSYADSIGEKGIAFNMKNYIKNDFVRNLLPDKSLLISKEDFLKILNNEQDF